MKTRWPTKPLGDLVSLEYGKALKAEERFENGSYPVYGSNGVVGFHNEAVVKKPTIVVGRKGAIGEAHFAEKGCWPIDTAFYTKFRQPDVVSLQYLLLWFRSVDLKSLAITATIPGLNRNTLYEQKVPVPPLAEQERIVKLLDEADKLRKLRAQADRRTAALIPELFHEMFGQENSWPVENLETLCTRVTVGYVGPMASEYVDTGVTFLRGQNIKRGRLDLSSVLFVSEDFHKRLEKSAIAPGDVVSVRTGKPGTTTVIPPSLTDANCADLIVMTCGPQINPDFLCELLNQRLGDQDSIAGATGIAQQHFNIGEARRLKVALPPLALQKEFAARVQEIREMEAAQAASRQRLDQLFQSLLHRAFNGEL